MDAEKYIMLILIKRKYIYISVRQKILKKKN